MESIEEKYKLDKDYYQIGKVSGKVSTGYIYEAIQILSPLKKLAMKQVWIELQGRKSLLYILNQLKYLCQFDHINLLQTYGYYIDGQKICILMDFYAADLQDLMKQNAQKQKVFSLEEIVKCLYQISDAYSYMVSNFSIAHRDIRPENIFIDNNNNFVLANFEIFKYGDVQGVNEYQISGAPAFFSPELYTVLKNQENTCKYSLEKNDIFSLGLVTLEMMFYDFQNFRKLKERQSETFLKEYLESKEKEIFPELLPLLMKMLEFDPEKRINFKMLFEELKNLQKLLEEKTQAGAKQIYEENKINHTAQEQEKSKRKQSEADKIKIQQENLYLKSMVESLMKEKEELEDINSGLQQKFSTLISKRKNSKKLRKDQELGKTTLQNSEEIKE